MWAPGWPCTPPMNMLWLRCDGVLSSLRPRNVWNLWYPDRPLPGVSRSVTAASSILSRRSVVGALAEALDALPQGDLPRVGDRCVHMFKALAAVTAGGSWAVARWQGLAPEAGVSLSAEAEQMQAA